MRKAHLPKLPKPNPKDQYPETFLQNRPSNHAGNGDKPSRIVQEQIKIIKLRNIQILQIVTWSDLIFVRKMFLVVNVDISPEKFALVNIHRL